MRNLTDNIRASAFVQFGRGHHFSFWQFSLPAYAHYTGNDSEHAVVSDILQPITTQRTYMSIPPTAVAAKAIITICMYRFVTVANDTQLHLVMSVDNTATGLCYLAACTADVRQWYLQNGLQLNPDKSEALVICIVNQLCVVDSSASSVSVVGVDLPVHEGAGCRPPSESDVPQTCLDGCSIVQLSRAGHPSHPISSNDGVSSNVSM